MDPASKMLLTLLYDERKKLAIEREKTEKLERELANLKLKDNPQPSTSMGYVPSSSSSGIEQLTWIVNNRDPRMAVTTKELDKYQITTDQATRFAKTPGIITQDTCVCSPTTRCYCTGCVLQRNDELYDRKTKKRVVCDCHELDDSDDE